MVGGGLACARHGSTASPPRLALASHTPPHRARGAVDVLIAVQEQTQRMKGDCSTKK
ncbi:jg1413, partial [Pararge aegeria aegeria]